MNAETATKIITLTEARAAIADIPALHQGGCGIAALALARWIKNSSMAATTLFVLGDNSGSYYRTNASAIIDSSIEPDSCSHIGLIVYDFNSNQQYIIDARGIYDMGEYPYINIVSKERIMVRSINRVDRWNDSFDRHYVAEIAKRLDIDLSDIDCRTKSEYRKATEQKKQIEETQTIEGYQSLLWEMLQPTSLLMSM